MRSRGGMTVKEMILKVMEVRRRYAKFEIKKMGKTWGNEEQMLGLVTDVGDLARLVLAKEGYRRVGKDLDRALRHELADCVWSLVVLADRYNIDLEGAVDEMVKDLKEKLKEYK